MALADFQALVDNLVRDPDSHIATADRDKAIDLARLRYSQDKPRQLFEDLAGDGSHLLAYPAAFEFDFSNITQIETPPDQTPPAVLGNADWQPYVTVAGSRIMFDAAPAVGAVVRVRFTTAHLLDGANDTIPGKHQEAVSCWAAALLQDQLASQFSGASLPTMDSDSVDHGEKAAMFSRRAGRNRARYFDELGIDPKRNVAAGATVNLSIAHGGGQGFMFKRQAGR